MMRRLMRAAYFSVAVMAVGCKARLADKAELEVAEFHRQFDAENFDVIHDAAHPDFKERYSREGARGYMRGIRRELGKVEWTTLKKRETRSIGSRTEIDLTYSTDFEHGEGSEIFNFRMKNGKAMLSGWRVESSDLVIETRER